MKYIVVIKNDEGDVVARGVGRSLNEAVDTLKRLHEEALVDSMLKILEDEEDV